MIREENRAEREVLSRTTSLFVKKKITNIIYTIINT